MPISIAWCPVAASVTDQQRWVCCRPGFFLPVRVLSRLFRHLFLDELEKVYQDGKLQFFGKLDPLKDPSAFARYLVPWREREWVVYAKPPFGGPQQVLEYLGRYTHKVAISNQRLLRINDGEVMFQWKDYRHHDRHNSRQMTLASDEFIRRFLIHTLPQGFQRIRYFGLLCNRHRQSKPALCRKLLAPPITELLPDAAQCLVLLPALAIQCSVPCPQCSGGILIRLGFLPPMPWFTPPPDSS